MPTSPLRTGWPARRSRRGAVPGSAYVGVEVVEVDAGRDAGTPDQERDPVVGVRPRVGVAGPMPPWSAVTMTSVWSRDSGGGGDGREHAADQVVGLADGLAVLRRHPAVGVAGDVGQRDVQERQGPPGRGQVAAGGLDERGVVGPDQRVVDALGPRPVEQGELRLGREHRTAQPGRLQRREHRADRVSRRRSARCAARRRSSFQMTPCPPLLAVDPAAGHHARVVGQGEGQLDLAAGVERGRALVDEAVEGRRVGPAEQGDRVGVEAVDRDHHHPGDLAGRPLRAERGWERPATAAAPTRTDSRATDSAVRRGERMADRVRGKVGRVRDLGRVAMRGRWSLP